MIKKPDKLPIISFRRYPSTGIDGMLLYLCEEKRYALSARHLMKKYKVAIGTIMNRLRNLKLKGFIELKKINNKWYATPTKEGEKYKHRSRKDMFI